MVINSVLVRHRISDQLLVWPECTGHCGERRKGKEIHVKKALNHIKAQQEQALSTKNGQHLRDITYGERDSSLPPVLTVIPVFVVSIPDFPCQLYLLTGRALLRILISKPHNPLPFQLGTHEILASFALHYRPSCAIPWPWLCGCFVHNKGMPCLVHKLNSDGPTEQLPSPRSCLLK